MTDSKDPKALIEEVLRAAIKCGVVDGALELGHAGNEESLQEILEYPALKTLMELAEKGRALERIEKLPVTINTYDAGGGVPCVIAYDGPAHDGTGYVGKTLMEAINAALEAQEQSDE